MKLRRRIGSVFLAFAMALSLIPSVAVSALAAEPGETVNRIRLMEKDSWNLATIQRAGYSTENVLWANVTEVRFFTDDGEYTNWGIASEEVPDCYSHEGYLATDSGTKISPSDIDRICVKLNFAYKGWEAFDPQYGVTAVFHKEDFETTYTEGAAGVREYAELSLKNGIDIPENQCAVTFMFQPIGATTWELYDIVYVNKGTSIGDNMPPTPDYGTFDFVSWQTNTDGSGTTLTSTTVINDSLTVYGTKTSAGGGTAYHVMRDSSNARYLALQDELADLYNAQHQTTYGKGDVQVKTIQINGQGDESTNPIYHTNGWNADASYYYVYNLDAYAADLTPENQNTRIPVDEVTGITATGTIDSYEFTLTIPKDELSLREVNNPGTSDTIIEISVREKLDDISKELITSESDVPDNVTAEVTFPTEDNKVAIPKDGSVTLLYKITVTGDEKAAYRVTDTDATWVFGDQLTGTLDTDGEAVIYVTKTFTEATDGKLTNSATLTNDNDTLPPDDGKDEDSVIIEVVDGEEEPTLEEQTVYVYVQFIGKNGSLTAEERGYVEQTYGEFVNENSTYVPIGTTTIQLPDPTPSEIAIGTDYFNQYLDATFTLTKEQVFLWETTADTFPLSDVDWTKLSTANGAAPFETGNGPYWHLDGQITLGDIPQTPDTVTITYHGNGGSFTNEWGTHTKTNETGIYGKDLTLYNNGGYFERAGYSRIGWATTADGGVDFQGAEKVTLNEDTFPGLSESKHIDLYAVWEKNAPTFEELENLDLKVTIDCVSNVGHADGQVPLIESTPGNETCVVEKADGETDTYEIWVKDPDDYIAQYNQMNQAKGYTHTYVGFQDNVKAFEVQWNGAEWVVDQDKVTILAKCMPEAPTDDQLKTLLDDAVKVQCVEESTHNCTFDVKAGYTVSGPTADGKGGWTYTVTVEAEPYVTDFNTKGAGKHWLVEGEADTKGIVLTWDADHNTWTRQEQVEFDVTCKPEPVQTYKINVDVINGTGTFSGTEVTTHILAKEGEDITITFAPDAGYALDTVKVDGKPAVLTDDGTYTFTNVAADHSITVVYATDAWNDEDDTTTGGDGIPDYKQVLIAYTTDGSGTVFPTTQVETLKDNADGKYVGTVNVGSTATANEGYAFAFWMGPNDSTFWSKVLDTTLTVEGGKTYTYTATFGTDLIGPKDPTGEDPDKPGDGIPDKYQVVVKYVAGNGGKITGKQVEVLTIYDAEGHYSTVGDVTATGSQAAAFRNWDFSRWVDPNDGVASWNPTLDQQTIENANGGETYVFTAYFRYDPYIPPVVDPDPDDPTPPVDPDKPQLNTEDHYAYIVGYEDGTVRPEGDITRAEVATIFFRLLTDESRDEFWSQTNPYSDVSEDAWYNNAVSTLTNAGIIDGYEDGTFKPNGNITRAEFATIAVRFFEATYEGENLFPDIDGHWAQDYINEAANAGIVDGYPDGTFGPQKLITRAEAMTMVNRTIDRHPHEDHLLDDMIVWPDNPETAWYYEQVQEATNSHEYTMHTDDEQNPYEIWTELLPVRDWAQLEKEWSDAHSGQSGGDVV